MTDLTYAAEKEQALHEESLSRGEYLNAAVRQYAGAYGAERTESAWILSPFDTWEKNPHYNGPAQPHPEDYQSDEEIAAEPTNDSQPFEEARWSHVEDDTYLPF
tara:strand:+ start:8460 stop:8771 length:312 start_codon:yes stop_codon:yes gene_type:complete